MYLRHNTTLCLLHAISPVHAGSGSATGAVDLPIQRERHTGWPHIQSSGVKGAFRDHCTRTWIFQDDEENGLTDKERRERAEKLAQRIFGKAEANESQAGAVAFSDARLAAFPVRSSAAPFVWVVCPALLKRMARDLELAGFSAGVLAQASVQRDSYVSLAGSISDDKVILEDTCLDHQQEEMQELGQFLTDFMPDAERLLLIPDDHFSFLVETATEIQAQIKIDAATGTTATGSLRYEELLPADSILYTLVFFGDERSEKENRFVMATLREKVKEAAATHIQMGGDMTLGRGIFKIAWKQA